MDPIYQAIQLLQLHILRAFFKAVGVDTENKDPELQDLLAKIRDRDVTPVAAIKAIREFSGTVYTFTLNKNCGAYSPTFSAIKEGAAEFGTRLTYINLAGQEVDRIGDADLIRCVIGNGPRVGLKEAKDIMDQIRSMRQGI